LLAILALHANEQVSADRLAPWLERGLPHLAIEPVPARV
jgi:hypothetical protein